MPFKNSVLWTSVHCKIHNTFNCRRLRFRLLAECTCFKMCTCVWSYRRSSTQHAIAAWKRFNVDVHDSASKSRTHNDENDDDNASLVLSLISFFFYRFMSVDYVCGACSYVGFVYFSVRCVFFTARRLVVPIWHRSAIAMCCVYTNTINSPRHAG